MTYLQAIISCYLLTTSVETAIVNVALDQPSWQSSNEYYGKAYRANDGDRNNVENMVVNSCAHTNISGYTTAWWQVDLGQQYNVSHILLTPRDWVGGPSRLAGFSVYVSFIKKQTWESQELCYHDSNPHSLTAHERRIYCTNVIIGRYVVIYNKRPVEDPVQSFVYSNSSILELCEVDVPVEVINCVNSLCSYCNTGWYGKRCQSSCQNCGGEQGCSKENGVCVSQSCVAGYYGQKCSDSCLVTNCYNNECNFNTGLCQQCNNNYYGPLCNQRCQSNCISCSSSQNCSTCTSGWYGKSCSLNCSNCGGTGSCNRSYGTCLVQSCKVGFYGRYCTYPCSYNCGDDRSCDFSTGKCNHCPYGKYGHFCDFNCPVGCRTCDNITLCYICNEGFYGRICGESCPGCGGNESCSKSNGTCLSPRCRPTYYGRSGRCDQVCPSNCAGDKSCEYLSGECVHGCTKGFYGSKCTQICPENCREDSCNKTSGKCSNGCSPGWNGTGCDSKCRNGTFGVNCSHKCGRCKNNVCDNVYGICHLGCESGWSNIRCDTETQEDNGYLATAITGGVLGALLIVLLGIIIFLAILRWRQTRKQKENIYMSQVDNSVSEDRAYSTVQRTFEHSESTSTQQATSSFGDDSSYEEMARTDIAYINTTFSNVS